MAGGLLLGEALDNDHGYFDGGGLMEEEGPMMVGSDCTDISMIGHVPNIHPERLRMLGTGSGGR